MELKVLEGRSTVRVQARATMHSVKASGNAISGSVTVDPEDVPGTLKLDLAVEIAGIRSGDFLTDMSSRRHVDTDRHPVARFVLTRASGTPRALRIEGTIDWRGRKVPIATTATGEIEGTTARGTASFDLDMRGFDLEAPRFLFLKVQDVVHVEVEIVAG
ncbi:MAG: YceI family protein [Deltaproteobacteria bacterium]|nr:YceI family protein [Deltaproteobacteria bacterium]